MVYMKHQNTVLSEILVFIFVSLVFVCMLVSHFIDFYDLGVSMGR